MIFDLSLEWEQTSSRFIFSVFILAAFTFMFSLRMGVLGSREYLCIHPTVSQSRDKNEECKNLIKGHQVSSNYN